MIRTVVVDDDPRALATHTGYLERLEEFEVVAVADSVTSARETITAHHDAGAGVDLVLLDLTLPDGHGTDVTRFLRSREIDVDFIAVTGDRSVDAVRRCLALGAVQYLIKPFGFRTFHDRMDAYLRYRRGSVAIDERASTQDEIDSLLSLRQVRTSVLPKGLTRTTYGVIVEQVRRAGRPMSAAEVGEACAVSRVTARRYLEYLADLGLCVRMQRPAGRGRPEIDYAWSG
ncbi:response regulator [Microbacterium oleivorans]|uniref:response regulator n=1 Tax=Microbacterium TaxID=33882 RepID=UPI00203E1E1C|nr:response regulator [Microbacterium oleivorans]MCM3695325.1 response regulator [Microbacterium oleivorans]